jgi:hypothetical protein
MKAKSTGVFSSRTVQVGVYRYEKPEQVPVDYKGKGVSIICDLNCVNCVNILKHFIDLCVGASCDDHNCFFFYKLAIRIVFANFLNVIV